MPVPEYLLAMKCMAARIGGTADEPSDVADITYLIRTSASSQPRKFWIWSVDIILLKVCLTKAKCETENIGRSCATRA